MLPAARNHLSRRYIATETRKRLHPTSSKRFRLQESSFREQDQKYRGNPFIYANRGFSSLSYDEGDTVQEDIERFTHDSMAELLPKRMHLLDRNYHDEASLDLELGEYTIWDDIQEETYIEETASDTPKPREDFSIHELLVHFDPQNPPTNSEDMELWLECEAQQESVLRYQKIIQAARDRKDYASLSLVQKQIVRWFQPLTNYIAERQKEFIACETSLPKTGKNYGPYLCALSPEKLAVITAHEALLAVLSNKKSAGTPFVAVVERIGAAVEQEVLVQAALEKRAKEMRKKNASPETTPELESVDTEALIDDTEASTDDDDDDDDDVSENPISLITDTQWQYGPSHLNRFLEEIAWSRPNAKRRRIISHAVRRARQIIEHEEQWSTAEKIQLGAALFQALLEKATVEVEGSEEMAFNYEKRWIKKDKVQSLVSLNETLYKMIMTDQFDFLGSIPTLHKPMIVPPEPWESPAKGGYRWLKVDMMRYHGCHTQKEVLANGDLTTVYGGLNALAQTPWKINGRILNVALECWDRNIELGDLPSHTDHEVPEQPIPPAAYFSNFEKGTPEYEEHAKNFQHYRESLSKHKRLLQKNMDLHSLRCSAKLKLEQAKKFREFDRIYFPYNIDFRGRAYPVPPHISNVGSDLSRGILEFADAKPLGSRGLYWLKVHLANFAGQDKMTFDQRANFVDENMDKIRQSAEDPFGGDRWWMGLEDPFQGLAACVEIVRAIDSGDPESYECSLAVHMDGSCNGLQHYAALGRDRGGGTAVNLCDFDEPQDVYVGVMHEVIRRVSEEARRELPFDTSNIDSLSRQEKRELLNNRAAKLVDGLIDRGVVKRTVMTSVYGVTYIGARQQIQEKIESKLESEGRDIDELSNEIFQACGYLATVTMEAIGDLFQGAKGTMNWLTTCARLISRHGYPVAWVSPIGLPAIQPYRQKRSATLVTLMQTVTLVDDSDDLPIHRQRQVSAFPPNYVHSLDSSHMLLTALEMERRGLTFSAVHDSFWTHPCDVDEMNEALREVFVDLYSKPLLEDLKKTWELRYPSITFPDLPPRGDLDLAEVKRAKYFFQ